MGKLPLAVEDHDLVLGREMAMPILGIDQQLPDPVCRRLDVDVVQPTIVEMLGGNGSRQMTWSYKR